MSPSVDSPLISFLTTYTNLNPPDRSFGPIIIDNPLFTGTNLISHENTPVKVYKIRNTQTNQYWTNGRWNKNGKVWTRMSDVKNTLNHMSTENFVKSAIVDYMLTTQSNLLYLMDQVINTAENSMEQEIEKLFNKNS
jgi:hypothetical protein